LASAPTAGTLKGQGATEYLVLLAVVLIVALVSVALLGFFPGMASDAQATQSKAYWASASPIAITEWGARYMQSPGTETYANYTVPYFRIKNNGGYTITLKKILAGNASVNSAWTAGWAPAISLSDAFVLAPGEEKTIGSGQMWLPDPGSGSRRFMMFGWIGPGAYPNTILYAQARSYCSPSAPYGTLIVPNFGFEYDVTIEGQTVTKRQIAPQPLIIKCMNNYN